MATIKDIANRTGVSITTVSRVLNYDKTLSITSDKRKLILEVAEELEYETPRNRKNSKSKKKKVKMMTIGILHFLDIETELEDPYYIAIRLGIEKKCLENNVQVVKIYKNSGNFTDTVLSQLEGLVVIGKFGTEDLNLIEKHCDRVVFVDSSPREGTFDSIVIDAEWTVKEVINYMLDIGFTKIGYLGGKEILEEYNTVLGETRKKAFIETTQSLDIYNKDWIFVDKFSHQSGYNMMKEALELDVLPEIFFAANDNIAIGAMKALYEAGKRVPDDISIIGLNDIPTAKYTLPPLTSVKIYSEFMGECAVDLLLEQISGRRIPKKLVIPTKIIRRESVKNDMYKQSDV